MNIAQIIEIFTAIKSRNGNAAIERNANGSLFINCTKPDYVNSESWGRGSIPMAQGERLVDTTMQGAELRAAIKELTNG